MTPSENEETGRGGRHARERRPGDAGRGIFAGFGHVIGKLIDAVVSALIP
jgi:hypothetical protein